jgi:hypothetical protein
MHYAGKPFDEMPLELNLSSSVLVVALPLADEMNPCSSDSKYLIWTGIYMEELSLTWCSISAPFLLKNMSLFY